MCISSKPTKSTKHVPTKGNKVSAAKAKGPPFLPFWKKPKGPTFVYQTRSYIPCKQAEVDEFNAKRAYQRSIGARICQRGLPPRCGIKFWCPCGGFHTSDAWSIYEVEGFYFCPDTIHFFLMKRLLRSV